ncbi:hypothetical protein K402DRAFT_61639 [Aulographum hederae CBS 113979]|uniref:Uncharacterized protein n=1 Tax=Aulographum hederae CBS 113979 TaxID=1176131 RepID=A0A6G1H1D2_9PEZI|nr:hypothetical protein K402DRAFT_61639 [Aulographum hederae CBS 113979]
MMLSVTLMSFLRNLDPTSGAKITGSINLSHLETTTSSCMTMMNTEKILAPFSFSPNDHFEVVLTRSRLRDDFQKWCKKKKRQFFENQRKLEGKNKGRVTFSVSDTSSDEGDTEYSETEHSETEQSEYTPRLLRPRPNAKEAKYICICERNPNLKADLLDAGVFMMSAEATAWSTPFRQCRSLEDVAKQIEFGEFGDFGAEGGPHTYARLFQDSESYRCSHCWQELGEEAPEIRTHQVWMGEEKVSPIVCMVRSQQGCQCADFA